jgi:hypothetical protein
MTPGTVALSIALLASALTACRRDEPRRDAASVATASVAAAPQDTLFRGTTAPVHRARPIRPGVLPALLRAVETSPSPSPSPAPGYDRVVFEFAGDSVPGYHVEYATTTVRRCGSGDPVAIAGAARLVVRFEPAQAHDAQGNATPAERDRALGLPAVREMKLVCDFEGQVEWVLGVAGGGAWPYRVSELTRPARLVVDIRHRP